MAIRADQEGLVPMHDGNTIYRYDGEPITKSSQPIVVSLISSGTPTFSVIGGEDRE